MVGILVYYSDSYGRYPRLSVIVVFKLDIIHRVARKEAQRQGHTHPIALGSATTAEGKTIGHVQN